ncbi:MAG: MoaD/ThiS family protein [Gammaproteobacteria bacterium]
MKTVTVTFFAAFRDQAGRANEQVTTEVASVSELFAELVSRWSSLETYPKMKYAINDEMVQADHALRDGDDVLFFPPVAGG